MDTGLQIVLRVVANLVQEHESVRGKWDSWEDEAQILREVTRRIEAVVAGETWPIGDAPSVTFVTTRGVMFGLDTIEIPHEPGKHKYQVTIAKLPAPAAPSEPSTSHGDFEWCVDPHDGIGNWKRKRTAQPEGDDDTQ